VIGSAFTTCLPLPLSPSPFLPLSLPLLADAFPRGPGLYFHVLKLLALMLAFLAWVRTCAWVNDDAGALNLNAYVWNSVMLAAGVLGLLLVWSLSAFGLGLLLLLLLYGVASLAYISTRDQRVPQEQRILTEPNLRELARRCLTLDFRRQEEPVREVLVRFLTRSGGEQRADPARAARIGGKKGYRLARQILADALARRASEVRVEPSRKKTAVRFGIDGVLHAGDSLSRYTGEAVINVYKSLCALDLSNKRKPQDGNVSAVIEGRTLDLRVATDGGGAGEKMVLRLLDRARPLPALAELGMRDKMREQVQGVLGQLRGLLLVCGPCDSGRTSTLYACLGEINRQQYKVMTVESPVAQPVPDVTQVEVNLKLGRTVSAELRGVLRQAPAVVLVGEVRDRETAEMACQAAQPGRLVLAALEADDAAAGLQRLFDLGVPPPVLADALAGVLAQRLVRALCPRCKVRYKPNPDLLRKANLPADKIKFFYRPPEEEVQAGKPQVCGHCGGTGYRGRTGVFELLLPTDRLRELIRARGDLSAVKQEAVKAGMRYLYEDGLRQVVEGNTSIQELLRVCKE
jgi:general secretion pathway protein E